MSARPHEWPEDLLATYLKEVLGRKIKVLTTYSEDLFLKDGLAHALLREWVSKNHRVDFDYYFFRSWERDPLDPPFSPGQDDVIFLGRPKPFQFSNYGLAVMNLERDLQHRRFLDANANTTGHKVWYKDQYREQVFESLVFERQNPEAHHRYFRDFTFFLYRCEEETFHRSAALCGLSSLGTLLLILILTSNRREQLKQQLQTLAQLRPEHRPDRLLEVCVRVDVADENHLKNLMKNISIGDPAAFDFQVEAVIVAKEGEEEEECFLRPNRYELRIKDDSNGKGYVRLAGVGDRVALSRLRFSILRLFAEKPGAVTLEALCGAAGFTKGREKNLSDQEKGKLKKLIHDLNAQLKEDVFRDNQSAPLIRFDRERNRYVFEGVKVVIGPS